MWELESGATGFLWCDATIGRGGPRSAAHDDPTRGVGNDPRSPGEGPGLVGDPAFAIGLVLVIAVVATAATILYVRLTRPPAAGR